MDTRQAIKRDEDSEETWVLDPKYSTARFTIKGRFTRGIAGRFEQVSGTIIRNGADVTRSRVEAAISSASINSGSGRRDAKLKSAEWLDAEKWPEILFESLEVERRDRDTLLITGTLRLGGISRKVALDVIEVDRSTSPRGEKLAYYAAKARFDRFDFGLKKFLWGIGRQVEVAINIQAIRTH